jgi:hypothetical protein
MRSASRSVLLLNCLRDFRFRGPNIPTFLTSPEDQGDQRRTRFRGFLGDHSNRNACLLGLGRADFLSPGSDVRMIADHLNLRDTNPLFGAGPAEGNPRFPSQDSMWLRVDIKGLDFCIVAAVGALQFKTAAEREYLRRIGADSVTEDLIQEVILANAYGVKTAGLLLSADSNLEQDRVQLLMENILSNLITV